MFYNEITIGDQNLKINLFLDIPYIQFGFPTIHFSMYNDDLQLDKKIGYISKKYNSVLLDKSLKKLMQSGEFAIENILSVIVDFLQFAHRAFRDRFKLEIRHRNTEQKAGQPDLRNVFGHDEGLQSRTAHKGARPQFEFFGDAAVERDAL